VSTKKFKIGPRSIAKESDKMSDICPTCGKAVSEHEAVEKKVGKKNYKFCSDTCATAYKEIKHKHEEVSRQ
jgi:YHS domain-containing protein